MSKAPIGRTKAFLSGSHKYSAFLEEFQRHLASFERNGLLDLWVDNKIAPASTGSTKFVLALPLIVQMSSWSWTRDHSLPDDSFTAFLEVIS